MRPLSIILATLLLATSSPTISHADPARKPWLGLVVRTSPKGLRVHQVVPGSPAQRAGLRPGDILTHLDKDPLSDLLTLQTRLKKMPVGHTFTLTRRDHPPHTLTMTAAPRPSNLDVMKRRWMGRALPPHTLRTLSGAKLSTAKLQGKPIILEFFATWCAGCKDAALAVHAVHQRHGDAVHVLAISSESARTLRPWRDARAHKTPVARDPGGRLHDTMGVEVFPLILVLDAQLRVRKVFEGTQDLSNLDAVVRALL